MVKFALNAREIVVIVVDTLRRSKILMFDICGGIADAVAFGPLLMTLDAGERAGQGGAAGTAVVVWFDMTIENCC